jgi:hypothetical protein
MRPEPTRFVSRASVTASFSGLGKSGSKNENCTSRRSVGCADTTTPSIASPGGCAARSSRSSVSKVRESLSG